MKSKKVNDKDILTSTYNDLGSEVGEELYGRTKNATNLRGGTPEASNLQVRPGGLRYVVCICEMWLVSSKRG
jgi:hypothetical protein